jgi:hypothetical protein
LAYSRRSRARRPTIGIKVSHSRGLPGGAKNVIGAPDVREVGCRYLGSSMSRSLAVLNASPGRGPPLMT